MRFLILGAGPAGLAFANSLAMKGESSFVVLDREMSGGGVMPFNDGRRRSVRHWRRPFS